MSSDPFAPLPTPTNAQLDDFECHDSEHVPSWYALSLHPTPAELARQAELRANATVRFHKHREVT
jgi:hypothetical protein